jgi:Histidine phosphatase superfamily (branch 1)
MSANAANLLSSGPARPVALTAGGRAQARALGAQIGGLPIDLAVGTRLFRTKQTIDLALDGRPVPVLIEPGFELTAGRRPRRRADGRLLVLEVPAHLEGPAPARGKRPRRATAPAGQGRNRHPGHRARTRPAVHHRGRHQRRAARAGTAFPNAVPYLLDQRAAWRSGRSGVLRLESSPDLAAIPLKSDKRRVDHGGVAPPPRRDPRRRA